MFKCKLRSNYLIFKKTEGMDSLLKLEEKYKYIYFSLIFEFFGCKLYCQL